MSLLNDFLKKNPAVLNKYVHLAYVVVDKTVTPLNRLMVHLLEVQGIDPRTRPGDTARKALAKAMDTVPVDTDEYQEDFNVAAAIPAFSRVGQKLAHLNLTKDQFKKMTDLSMAQDTKQLELTKEFKPLTTLVGTRGAEPAEDPLHDLSAFISKYHVTSLPSSSMKDALKTLKKYAEMLDKPSEKEVVETKRQPASVGTPKRTSKPKTIKAFGKKGVFRRVKDED